MATPASCSGIVKLEMPCSKVAGKKYADRPSPAYHANDCPNQQKTGNDGEMYESVADKNGVYRWRKAKKTSPRRPARGSPARPPAFRADIDAYHRALPGYKAPVNDVSFVWKALPSLRRDLKALHVKLHVIPWSKHSVTGFEKEVWAQKTGLGGDHLLLSEYQLYLESKKRGGKLAMNHSLSRKVVAGVNEALFKHFPGRTRGFRSNFESIDVALGRSNPVLHWNEPVPKLFDCTIEFEESADDQEAEPFVDEIFAYLGRDVAQLSEHDAMIVNGELNVHALVYNVKKFKDMIKKVSGRVDSVVRITANEIEDDDDDDE